MFTERLTKEQINNFLKEIHINSDSGFRTMISHIGQDGIRIDCENFKSAWDYSFVVVLEDFTSRGISHPNLWTNYLLGVFGKEYREAYNKIACI